MTDFFRVFNWKSEQGRGCSAILINSLLANMAIVFFNGVFYSGFLANNGIDIVRVGIISFIPYIAWALSIFAPKVFASVKRRRGLMVFNSLFYYFTTVIATTVMPLFVQDYAQRTVWFAVFVFAGNAVNAVLSPGLTPWQVNFIPKDAHGINVFVSYRQIMVSVAGTGTALVASLWMDTLLPDVQARTITLLRYAAVAVVLAADVFMYLLPKEYPYNTTEAAKMRLTDVFLVPLRNRRFLLACLGSAMWMAVGTGMGSAWTYYLVESAGAPYSYTYIQSVVFAVSNILLLPFSRKLMRRRGWFWVHVMGMVLYAVLSAGLGFTNANSLGFYAGLSVVLGVLNMVNSFSFGSMFYLHLPDKDQDTYTVFWNLMRNVLSFLGGALATWVLALVQTWQMPKVLGVPLEGAQIVCWIQSAAWLGVVLYHMCFRGLIKPDADK